jgi:hypothetical protein
VGKTIGTEGEGGSRLRCNEIDDGSKPQKPVLEVSISRRSTMLAVGVGNDETASDIADGANLGRMGGALKLAGRR